MKKKGLLKRLFLTYLILLIVIGVVSFSLFLVSHKISDATSSMYNIDYKKKETTDALLENLIDIEETTRRYILLHERTDFSHILETSEEIENQWDFLTKSSITYNDQETQQLKDGRALWNAFLSQFHSQIKNLPRDSAQLEQIFITNGKQIEYIAGIVKKSNQRARTALDLKVVYLNNLGNEIAFTIWWALAFACTFGLIIPLFSYYKISRDIKSIQIGIKHIADGNFLYKIPIDSHDEIGHLADALNHMANRLKELDDMKAEFVSVVSHELKTPLTSMKEAANLLLEEVCGELRPKQKRMITIMDEGINRLLQLTNELLDLARLESGAVVLNNELFDLNTVISTFVSGIKPYADNRGILLKFLDNDEACPVRADKNKLVQVLTNLTHNAIKYSKDGGEVILRIHKNNSMIDVDVVDYGKGMSEEDIPLVFEKFYQSKTTRGHSGIGLGLAISKCIIEAHGGTIYAKSTLEKGSTFSFSIPAAY